MRFGLRVADDVRIRDTAKVIDALLKVETPTGSTWHRYNDDGYGEHEDGLPFDGTGIGRGWPLLTGERAHYELAAGRGEVARQLLATMESFSNESGLIPEQVWDSPDIAEREPSFRPTFRLGHAAGLGARRVSQAAALAARWPALRPAAANGATLSEEEDRIPAPDLAVQPQAALAAARKALAYRV